MRSQPFDALSESGLLVLVERVVVEEHAAVFRDGRGAVPWAPPVAYRWIRYEDPDPVGRLAEAAERLEREWAELGPGGAPALAGWTERAPLAPALGLARDLGFE